MRGSPNREWRSEEVAEESQVRTVQAVESQRTADGYTQVPVVVLSLVVRRRDGDLVRMASHCNLSLHPRDVEVQDDRDMMRW